MAKWLMNLSVTKDGTEKIVPVRADSFVDLLKEYTKILRSISEDDVIGASLTPPAPLFERGMVRLRLGDDDHEGGTE
tara:strand:+ start:4478 stop:4708 length:231 start_codon:yes stop_codon:yes gene_type:complete